jgi:predicted ATP-grasp superfamily ATP-dependent carboligase
MDHHVTIIGAYGQHLRQHFAFDFPEPENVELLMDKQRFVSFAEFNGWAIPHTYTCNSDQDVNDAARRARFPLLLKPRVKNPVFAAKSRAKVYRCNTVDELLMVYAMVREWEPGVIIQEWIPGGDDEVYFSFHYLAQDGSEVGSFEGRKLRQHPPECGNTSAAVPVLEPRLHDISLDILRAAGAAGFCSVEYKRHPETDVFYITEPTVGRVNLQLGTATGNGVNLPAMAYRHLMRLAPLPVRRPRRPRTWVHVKKDLRTARHYVQKGELTWLGYLASLSGPRIYPVWSAGEYRMAGAKAWSIMGRARRRLVRHPRLAWLTAAAAGAASLFN